MYVQLSGILCLQKVRKIVAQWYEQLGLRPGEHQHI